MAVGRCICRLSFEVGPLNEHFTPAAPEIDTVIRHVTVFQSIIVMLNWRGWRGKPESDQRGR